MTKVKSEVVRSKDLGLVYWGRVEAKQAVSSDGKMIGLVRGILVDPKTWTIPYLVAEGNKDALEKLSIQGGDLVTIPTRFVKSVSYMVELNTDLTSMIGAISEYKIERSEKKTDFRT